MMSTLTNPIDMDMEVNLQLHVDADGGLSFHNSWSSSTSSICKECGRKDNMEVVSVDRLQHELTRPLLSCNLSSCHGCIDNGIEIVLEGKQEREEEINKKNIKTSLFLPNQHLDFNRFEARHTCHLASLTVDNVSNFNELSLVNAIASMKSLSVLHLVHVTVNVATLQDILSVIVKNNSIKDLSLEGLSIRDECSRQEVVLVISKLAKLSNLHSLNVTDCSWIQSCLSLLLQMVQTKNTNLTSLSLQGIQTFSFETINMLSNWIQSPTCKLLLLNISNCSPQRSLLNWFPLFKALCANTSIQEFHFSDNGFNNVQYLCAVLQINKSIKILDIQKYPICNLYGFQLLQESLRCNMTLEYFAFDSRWKKTLALFPHLNWARERLWQVLQSKRPVPVALWPKIIERLVHGDGHRTVNNTDVMFFVLAQSPIVREYW